MEAGKRPKLKAPPPPTRNLEIPWKHKEILMIFIEFIAGVFWKKIDEDERDQPPKAHLASW